MWYSCKSRIGVKRVFNTFSMCDSFFSYLFKKLFFHSNIFSRSTYLLVVVVVVTFCCLGQAFTNLRRGMGRQRGGYGSGWRGGWVTRFISQGPILKNYFCCNWTAVNYCKILMHFFMLTGFASVNLHHQDESALILSLKHKYWQLTEHLTQCIKILM